MRTSNYGGLEASQILKTTALGRISKDRAQRERRRRLGTEYRVEQESFALAHGREVSVRGADPKLASTPCCRQPAPHPSQLLDPNFPVLLTHPQVTSPEMPTWGGGRMGGGGGPSATLSRKRFASGMLCWAMCTKFGLGKM